MREERKARHVVQFHDSLTAFIEYADGPSAMPMSRRKSHQARPANDNAGWDTHFNYEFFASDNWQEAMGIAKKGYVEVRDKVDRRTNEVLGHVAEVIDFGFEGRFDVTGGMVDVSRFVEGEPECMVDYVLQPVTKHGNLVTLLVNASFNAYVTAQQIQNQGAGICALIEVLGKTNHNVEIWMEDATRGDYGHQLSILTKINDAADPIDVNALMFALAHPSYLRRFSFSCMERMGEKDRKRFHTGAGYGGAISPLCKDVVNADLVLGDPNEVQGRFDVDWVLGKLKELGIEVE